MVRPDLHAIRRRRSRVEMLHRIVVVFLATLMVYKCSGSPVGVNRYRVQFANLSIRLPTAHLWGRMWITPIHPQTGELSCLQ